MGSKLYIEGYEKVCPNRDRVTYCFDPTDPEGPSLHQCKGSIPKVLYYRFIGIIEDKIYVLDEGEAYGYKRSSESPLRVFDPLHQSWKELCHPPFFYSDVSKLFALGHKLVVSTGRLQPYMFNTREVKWEDGPIRKEFNSASYFNDLAEDIVNNKVHAVVEFKGFLIAVLETGHKLVAYRWDSNGVPKLYRVLHELDGIFCPFLPADNYAMGKCDGGRMWFVYLGMDLMQFWHTRVAVFRVSISNDSAGNPVLSADLEAAEFYRFFKCNSSSIKSAFSLCHQSNGEDKKNLCGTIVKHPRC